MRPDLRAGVLAPQRLQHLLVGLELPVRSDQVGPASNLARTARLHFATVLDLHAAAASSLGRIRRAGRGVQVPFSALVDTQGPWRHECEGQLGCGSDGESALFEEARFDAAGVGVHEGDGRVLGRELFEGEVGHGDGVGGGFAEGEVVLQIEVGEVDDGAFGAGG